MQVLRLPVVVVLAVFLLGALAAPSPPVWPSKVCANLIVDVA